MESHESVSLDIERALRGRLTEVKELDDKGYVIDRTTGKLENGIRVEICTRVGTDNERDPLFRRETNRRFLFTWLEDRKGFNFKGIQLALFENGTIQLLSLKPKWEENITKLKEILPELDTDKLILREE